MLAECMFPKSSKKQFDEDTLILVTVPVLTVSCRDHDVFIGSCGPVTWILGKVYCVFLVCLLNQF